MRDYRVHFFGTSTFNHCEHILLAMIIFWNKRWCSAHRVPATINGPSDASIIEWLRSVIMENGRGKVIRGVMLLHDNARIHMFTLLGFIQLNACTSSRGLAPSDSHLLSNLNKFVRSKNLSSDNEAVTTVEKTISLMLIENFFDSVLQSFDDQWQRVKVRTLNKCENYFSTV